MNAILIDDEKAACEATRLMLETFCSNVNVVGSFNSVDDGAFFLNNNSVDLVFLDIEMPKKNGFELFNMTNSTKYQVVFTTGHHDYAIKAFKYAACHYLLKPLLPEELIAACRIAEERLNVEIDIKQISYLKNLLDKKADYPESIVVSVKNGYEIIPIKQITQFKGERNYTWIHTVEENILTPKTLKEFENILDPKQFYRIHQSHLVNRLFLKKIDTKSSGSLLMLDGTKVPISRHRKKDFIEWLQMG